MLLHATFIPHIMQKSHKPFSIYQFLKAAFVVEYLSIFQKFTFHVVQDNSKLDLSLTTQISSCLEFVRKVVAYERSGEG